jgi:hypothetical protein
MMVVTTWTGREVTALRAAMRPRHTQVQFAERIGCSFEAVGKWERLGAAITLRPKYSDCMDTQLARLSPDERAIFDAHLAGASPASRPIIAGTGQFTPVEPAIEDVRSDSAGGGERGGYAWEVDDVKRREFGKLAATGSAAMLFTDDRERIGMSDVQRLLNGVDALEQEDQKIGGARLVGLAVDQLARTKNLLDTCAYDSVTGSAFTSAAGELAVQAGWLAFDADQHSLARRCYADAMALGTEANDNDLIAHTCLHAANQSCSLVRSGLGSSPHKALQLADRARDLVRGRPPGRIHALIAVREAQAYGLLGDRAAFGRATATAWRELDQAVQFEPLEEVPQWLRFMTHAEIGGHEARGYGDLGDLPRSLELHIDAADRAADRQQAGIRNAITARAWVAATKARIGDLNGALEAGGPVLADLATVSSTRTLRFLKPVRLAVDKFPVGGDFRDQFDALAQKAITA